ncbi:MAG: membrane protein insertion efficiency factor YidD [bacterium]
MLRVLLLFFIKVYQKVFSPDHGIPKYLYPHGYCKYTPSCSEYAKIAISKHGVINGGILACKRLLHCNPFSKGGIDDVPEKLK